jgi:thymidine kinase
MSISPSNVSMLLPTNASCLDEVSDRGLRPTGDRQFALFQRRRFRPKLLLFADSTDAIFTICARCGILTRRAQCWRTNGRARKRAARALRALG